MVQDDWFNQRLPDGGPLYAETDPGRILVEPWNAISSLFIIIPAIYWLVRIRKDLPHFRFMLYCIPLIILGGTGSTLFHAFRAHRFFLFLDIVPTAMLTLALSIYFWLKILRKWWHILLIIIPVFLARVIFFRNLPQHIAINISYAITGFITALPLIFLLLKTRFYRLTDITGTLISFMLALFFRQIDAEEIPFLPMGTHFLWHVFSGPGAYFILSYLYFLRKRELALNNNPA